MIDKPPILSDEQVWDYARRNLDPASRVVQVGTRTHREAQRDADAAYYEPLIEQAQEFYRKPFVKFRRDIRNLLGKQGIYSNPGWTEDDIVHGIEKLIEQAKAEVAREIIVLLDSIFEQRAFVEYHVLFDTFRKAIESKYTGGKK